MQALKYVVTADIARTLEYKIGMKGVTQLPALKRDIGYLEDAFLSRFQGVLDPALNLYKIPADALAAEMEIKTEQVQAERNLKNVVSMDKVYAPNADLFYEITRETDPRTGKKGYELKNRWGTPPLEEQVALIRKKILACPSGGTNASDHKVLLVDIGAFSGDTLEFAVKQFEANQVKVGAMVIGLSAERTEPELRVRFGHAMNILQVHALKDWLELRDLLLIDGRKVPDEFTRDGRRAFIPYTEKMSDWATVPKKNASTAREICLDYNAKLIEILKNNGFETSAIGDFVQMFRE